MFTAYILKEEYMFLQVAHSSIFTNGRGGKLLQLLQFEIPHSLRVMYIQHETEIGLLLHVTEVVDSLNLLHISFVLTLYIIMHVIVTRHLPPPPPHTHTHTPHFTAS